jgi:hypothetical protein
VIVWGVDCRQTETGDVPTSAVLITDPTALKSLLDSAIGGLTLPAHSGVENIAIVEGSDPGGFVVTHIPVGTSVPYQTLYPKQEYYIRAGSSFVSTPHSVLAGLFGRAPQPIVAPILRYRNTQLTQGLQKQIRVALQVHVRNDGRGFGEDIFCIVDIKADGRCTFAFPTGDEKYVRWRTINDTRNCFTIRLTGLVLPPGTEQNAFEILIDLPSRDVSGIFLVVTCGSRGGPGSAVQIEFPAAIVADIYDQYTANIADVQSMRLTHARADSQIRSCLK